MQKRRSALPIRFLALLAFVACVFFARPIWASTESFKPPLSVPIPNVNFSAIQVTPASDASPGFIDIPWLAQYIIGVYKYSVYAASLLATVMFMVGGFLYLTAGHDSARVTKGKGRMADAVIGMLLVIGAYTLLNVVNPSLTIVTPLHITQVERLDFKTTEGVLKAFGNIADESAYSSPEAGTPTTPVEPGQYRQLMMAACGARDGLSLPPADRIERLKKIVSTWKTVGADQGGAIYVRGGSPNCGFSNPQTSFVLGSMVTLSKNNVTTTMSDACKTAVSEASAAANGTAVAKIASANESCRTEWVAVYNDLIMKPAKEAGLLCGDCFSFQMSLYGCFDKNINYQTYFSKKRVSQVCPSPGAGYVFVLGNNAEGMTDEMLTAAVKKLKFGDVIAYQQLGGQKTGHVFLYTGGAGLGYEMLEMGGGGSNDVTSAGGVKASKNAGYKWVSAGVQAHSSASTFLAAARKSALAGGGKGCVYAFRPLEQ